MTVSVKFEDNDYTYTVDFFKLCQALGISEDQVKQAIYKQVSMA